MSFSVPFPGQSVSDPTLLAQLNGGGNVAARGAQVKDPTVLAQLNGTAANPLQNSSLMQGIYGAGDAVRNNVAHIINTLDMSNVPGAAQSGISLARPIQDVTNTNGGLAGKVGNVAGDVLTYASGAGLGGALGLGGEGALGAAQKIAGAGAYGATQNPKDPITAAIENMGVQGLGDGLGSLFSPGAKVTPADLVNQKGQDILQGLSTSGGIENNAQDLASAIKANSDAVSEKGAQLYKDFFNTPNPIDGTPIGNTPIYKQGISPGEDEMMGQSTPSIGGKYAAFTPTPGMDADLDSLDYNRTLKSLDATFRNDPTVLNAHTLQSQLGYEIRQLQKSQSSGNLSIADGNTMQGYVQAQKALKSDLGDFLTSTDPALADQYSTAQSFHLNQVVPYRENPSISRIASGETVNPNSLSTLFKSPEPETQKVISDLGDQGKNQIIYGELAKSGGDPDKMTTIFNNLDAKGLSSYITPKVQDSMNDLQSSIANRDITEADLANKRTNVQRGIGAVLGLAAAHPLSAFLPPMTAEAMGAGIGGYLGPKVANALPDNMLSKMITGPVSLGKSALIGSNVNGGH